jgi:hypothetical protein
MQRDMAPAPDELPDWEPVDDIDVHPPVISLPQMRAARLVDSPAIDLTSADVGRWVGTDPPEVAFTVAELVPRAAVTVLGGDGGAGKGVLLQTAATCVAAGLPFLGHATRHSSAVYVSAEDPEGVLHARQARINADLGLDMSDLGGRLFIKSAAERELYLFGDGKPTALAGLLEDELAARPDIGFVGIDSATLVFDDEEISRRRVGAFMRDLNRRASRLGVAVVMLIHTSKSSEDSPAKAFSGSTAWMWQARSGLLLKAETRDDAPSLILVKANYAKPGKKVELKWTERHVLAAADAPDAVMERFAGRALQRDILSRIDKAWAKDAPLSSAPSAGGERYLPRVMARAGHKMGAAKDAMLELIDLGAVVTDRRTSRTPKGLRIEKAPDWYKDQRGG